MATVNEDWLPPPLSRVTSAADKAYRNITFINQELRERTQHVEWWNYQEPKRNRHDVPYGDKLKIVNALHDRGQLTIKEFQRRFRKTYVGPLRHVKELKFRTLKNWSAEYARHKPAYDLLQAKVHWLGLKASEIMMKIPKNYWVPHYGLAPILEEYLCARRCCAAKVSQNRSIDWLQTEAKHALRNRYILNALRPLASQSEYHIWSSLGPSIYYIRNIMVRYVCSMANYSFTNSMIMYMCYAATTQIDRKLFLYEQRTDRSRIRESQKKVAGHREKRDGTIRNYHQAARGNNW